MSLHRTEFDLKVRWVRRRARRLMAFYKIDRALAVFDANLDWIGLHGPRLHMTPDHLTTLKHHEKNR